MDAHDVDEHAPIPGTGCSPPPRAPVARPAPAGLRPRGLPLPASPAGLSGALHTDRAVDLVLEMLVGPVVDWAQVTLIDRAAATASAPARVDGRVTTRQPARRRASTPARAWAAVLSAPASSDLCWSPTATTPTAPPWRRRCPSRSCADSLVSDPADGHADHRAVRTRDDVRRPDDRPARPGRLRRGRRGLPGGLRAPGRGHPGHHPRAGRLAAGRRRAARAT